MARITALALYNPGGERSRTICARSISAWVSTAKRRAYNRWGWRLFAEAAIGLRLPDMREALYIITWWGK